MDRRQHNMLFLGRFSVLHAALVRLEHLLHGGLELVPRLFPRAVRCLDLLCRGVGREVAVGALRPAGVSLLFHVLLGLEHKNEKM